MRSIETVKSVTTSGKSVSVELPIGSTYDALQFALTNATKAQVLNLRQSLNSRLVSDFKNGSILQMLNDYYKRDTAANVLTLNFNDDTFSTLEQKRYFGLATMGLKQATVSFDFDEAATNPQVSVTAIKSSPFPAAGLDGQGQWIEKQRFHTFTANAGRTEITTLPTPDGAMIKAIHIKKSDINGAELRIDNTVWHDGLQLGFKAVNELILKQAEKPRAPQSGFYHMDFAIDGDMFNTLPLSSAITDYRLVLDCETGGPVEIYIEYLDRWHQTSF